MPQVLIVGGGVSGLTSSLQLARAGYDVEIWQTARGMAPPNWLWEYPPFHVEPQEKAREWARVSLEEFMRLATVAQSNVHMLPVIMLGSKMLEPNPGQDFLPNFKAGPEAMAEAHRLLWSAGTSPRPYVDAWMHDAPVCNSAKY